MLTAAAIGRLVEEGRLRLDEEIRTYVPQFPKAPGRMTLRQVMADAGGIDLGVDIDGPLSRNRCAKAGEAVQYLASVPGGSGSGGEGWVLASAAVETAAGEPFFGFMREKVFVPLGMKDTGAEPAAEENPEAWGEEAEDPPPARAVRDLVAKPLGLAESFPLRAGAPARIYAAGFGPHPVVHYALHARPIRNVSCYAGALAFYSTPSDLVRLGMTSKVGKDAAMAAVLVLREPGVVVAVTSAFEGSDTGALARRVAAAFVEPAR
jgi:CubicO group peptidase (beta-lactamase class C family)